ncbi:hypothetical protein AVEN_249311-1 [Araneus ventricosus]|uniref:Uncharacterized protein n=1 Tax=Araneus ventricosus TaxID=182803 RepID=A0A4Y2NVH5_ARAVE|nr:hypothetical protein AVEN_249311-1 [Araneus ventricosus]
MQSAVITAFFYCCSSNRNLMHGQCPDGKDSWCRYKRALSDKKQYLEKSTGLPNSFMKVIKATYLELCDKNLLKKCLHVDKAKLIQSSIDYKFKPAHSIEPGKNSKEYAANWLGRSAKFSSLVADDRQSHSLIKSKTEIEEHLLPPPYQTNCRDNGPSDDGEMFTNPNSYQVCLEMCKSEYSKEMYGCDYGITMQLSTNHLCHVDHQFPNISDESESELRKHFYSCTQNCKTECLKLQYKYIMKKRKISGFEQERKTGWSQINIYVKNTVVTVIRHVPLYGSGELFSHIGGLLGCWFGVSVFTFTDIMEKVFWKAVSWKTDKIQKSPAAVHLN